jgi:hypothetical protein
MTIFTFISFPIITLFCINSTSLVPVIHVNEVCVNFGSIPTICIDKGTKEKQRSREKVGLLDCIYIKDKFNQINSGYGKYRYMIMIVSVS